MMNPHSVYFFMLPPKFEKLTLGAIRAHPMRYALVRQRFLFAKHLAAPSTNNDHCFTLQKNSPWKAQE